MPEVSRVSEADYAALSRFLAAFPDDESGSAKAWLNRMRSWWDLNPAYDDSFARGWMLRERGKIVGFLGSIPWKFQLGGRETTVFAGTTWRVLPEYRGMSIALKRRQMDEHEDVLHFSTTPRAEVERLLTRLGYEPMRRGQGDETHSVIVLDFEKWLRTRLKGRASAEVIAKRAARPLKAFQKLRMRRLGRCAHHKVRELHEADAAFDDLWQRTRTRYPTTNVRTSEAVNWYCFSAPESGKKLLGYFDGERLAGYMVLLPAERRGLRILECVDLWIEPGPRREVVLGALVEKGRRFAEKESFDLLHLPHFDRRTAAAYGRLGLLQRRGPRRPAFYMGPSELMHQLTPGNSYIVLAEGDYGL
jgi:hypothetical protein